MDKQNTQHDLLPRPLRLLAFAVLIVIALFAIRLIDRHVMARMTSSDALESQPTIHDRPTP